MKILSTEKLKYEKPDLNEFLIDYNELFAEILVVNFSNFKYLASATINRLEAQTHLYEYVEKYIQIVKYLDDDPHLKVIVSRGDRFIYGLLKEIYGNRISGDSSYVFYITFMKIKFIIKLLYYLFFKLVISFIAKSSFAVNKKLKKYKYIFRTQFDFRCKSNLGYIRDEYFEPLIDDIKRCSNVLVIYNLLNWTWSDICKFLKTKKNVDFDVCLGEYFLTPVDICKAFYFFTNSHIRCEIPLIFKGIDISKVVQLSLDEEYYRYRGLVVYLEYFIARKILKLNPERVFYPFENQTWEKMYPYIKNKLNIKTFIVGFQHTGFSYKLLNYFPSKKEKNLPIFPNKIITTGNIFKNLFHERAYLPSIISVGAALRHNKHVNNGQFRFINPVQEIYGKIAYAFSSDIEKHFRIIKLLIEIFKNNEIIVYLKFHPLFNERMILKKLNQKLPVNLVPASTIPWNEIYKSVDAILYDDNSISIEGILNGIKTYFFNEEEPIYEIERMFGFNEWNYTLDKKGLIKLKQSIINKTYDKLFDIDQVRKYINEYFSEYSKERSFRSFFLDQPTFDNHRDISAEI